MSASDEARTALLADKDFAGQLAANKIFHEFCSDREALDALRVTTNELQALSRASLLGTLSCRQDVLFILDKIRKPLIIGDSGPSPASAPPPPLSMTETIRRAAFAKMAERDSRNAKLARMVWRGIKMMFERWHDRTPTINSIDLAARLDEICLRRIADESRPQT
jgi:hypothetical protein